MNENNINKIILICVIILLIYLILRSVKNNAYAYPTIPVSTASNVVYDKRNVHYYMPRYNSYKSQFYN